MRLDREALRVLRVLCGEKNGCTGIDEPNRSSREMIVIAPTAFKGTLSAAAVTRAMAEGARAVSRLPVVEQPVSDGGPGLIDALSSGGEVREVSVRGPHGAAVTARILLR